MHILMTLLLELLRRLGVHGLMIGLAGYHVVVVLLDLLVAHYLVQLHLAVRELPGVHLLVLRGAYLGDLVGVHLWPLLAVHVVVLPLSLVPTRLIRIIVLVVLEMLKLRLRLVIRIIVVVVQCM